MFNQRETAIECFANVYQHRLQLTLFAKHIASVRPKRIALYIVRLYTARYTARFCALDA